MRTDVAKKVKAENHKTSESLEAMKTRKSLHPLQQAAGDKENLVGAGRMPPAHTNKDSIKSQRILSSPSSSVGKVEKKKHFGKSGNKTITAEDLTSEAGPSEHYWETLAERRRVALDKALQENRQLNERVAALEEENEQCRKLLEESRALVITLTELFDSNKNETDNNSINDSSFSSTVHDDLENDE